MAWYPISTKGELAKELAAVTEKTIAQLDLLDGQRDDMFAISDIERDIPNRVAYGDFEVAAVIDNGNGRIDGDDVLVKQIGYKSETAFVGGRLSRILDGFETSAWRNPRRIKEELPELRAARSLLAELQRHNITLFSDLRRQANEVFREVFKKAYQDSLDQTPKVSSSGGGCAGSPSRRP